MKQIKDVDNNELIGRFDAAIGKSIKESCNDLNRVNLSDYEISQAALTTIGQSIKQMSLELETPSNEIIALMKKSVYEVKGDLIFLFELEEVGDVVIVIPFGYFNHKNDLKIVH